MTRNARTIFAALCVVCLIGFAREARAIAIENDVDLDWTNVRFASSDRFITVLGMPRLFEGDDPANLLFDINVIAPQDLGGLGLVIKVVDLAGNEILTSGGTPLQLLSPSSSPFNWEELYDKADPNDPEIVDDPTHATLRLSDFQNFNLLSTITTEYILLLSGSFLATSTSGRANCPILRIFRHTQVRSGLR